MLLLRRVEIRGEISMHAFLYLFTLMQENECFRRSRHRGVSLRRVLEVVNEMCVCVCMCFVLMGMYADSYFETGTS